MRGIIVALFCLVLTACSVSYSFTGADIPAEAKTFSVSYFGNSTALAGPQYRQQVTEALKDFLLGQTPLNLAKNQGDLHFSGTVTKYDVSPIALQTGDQGARQRLTIALKVTYVNSFDEKKSFEQTFTRFADFDTDQAFDSVEDALIEEINEQLIQDIFNASVGNW